MRLIWDQEAVRRGGKGSWRGIREAEKEDEGKMNDETASYIL